jgi:hypothetical protein
MERSAQNVIFSCATVLAVAAACLAALAVVGIGLWMF